ncbi:hypothetical protein ABT330_25130 [Streptomyces sp. NPDC000658]|uniref:hypothetical protein n=1 Tax=Streptomyces sp. NPDC000658 TaxID=3154266 RepID=UPI003333D8D3
MAYSVEGGPAGRRPNFARLPQGRRRSLSSPGLRFTEFGGFDFIMSGSGFGMKALFCDAESWLPTLMSAMAVTVASPVRRVVIKE